MSQILRCAETTQTRSVLSLSGAVIVPAGPHPFLRMCETYPRPFVNIAWFELVHILQTALPPDTFVPDHNFLRYRIVEEDGGWVIPEFEGLGEVVRTRILIGADGGRSTVRAQALRDGPPTYSGVMSWRGVLNSDSSLVPSQQQITISDGGPEGGPSKMFLAVDIQARLTAWVAFAFMTKPPVIPEDGSFSHAACIKREFGSWENEVFNKLIDSTDPDTILPLAIHERGPIQGDWGVGRVSLVGDAAHMMQPWLGQGTNTTIEDAYVLADSLAQACNANEGPMDKLSDASVVESALRQYEKRRRTRTDTLQIWSSQAPLRPLNEKPPPNVMRQFMRSKEEDDWMYTFSTEGPPTSSTIQSGDT